MSQEITTTTGNQVSILSDRLTVATELVKPASDDAIQSKLISLQRSGLQWPPGIDAKAAPQIYCYALKKCSLHALKVAVERIIQGEEGVTGYIPTPPALAAIVRKVAAPLFDDCARIRETLDAIKSGREATAVKDPAAIERVRKLRQQVKDAADALRIDEAPGELPERYWRNKQDPDPNEERPIEDRWAEATRGEDRD